MIRAVVFAAIVSGATWASQLYDRYIRNNREEDR